jgi:aryl-alcohol dehydrogenase-like predicted oxidoreductase
MKFALGSAGWRTQYGSFSESVLDDEQAIELLESAWTLGFEFIDTAPTYGDTEKLLGRVMPLQKIATKVTVDPFDASALSRSIFSSLQMLKLQSLELAFVHNWDLLSAQVKESSAAALQQLVEEKVISRWGFSTYEVSEIRNLSFSGWKNLSIQINTNILDQRIMRISEEFKCKTLMPNDIQIWARSIFLQGVLLNTSNKNPFLQHPDLVNFHKYCSKLGVSPIVLCLEYIKRLGTINVAILGITNFTQLKEITNAMNCYVPDFDLDSLASRDVNLIDPRRWK